MITCQHYTRIFCLPFDAHCYHMDRLTAIKHPVPDRVKSSFVIYGHPGTLPFGAELQSARMSKNYK